MSGAERERRLRDALTRLISAYGRTGRAQNWAVKNAQRVLAETADRQTHECSTRCLENPCPRAFPVRAWLEKVK